MRRKRKLWKRTQRRYRADTLRGRQDATENEALEREEKKRVDISGTNN